MWTYYLAAILLLVVNTAAWLSNFFALPGNWIIVASAALFASLRLHSAETPSVRWSIVLVLIILAVGGELMEFLLGAAGAARQGASRRSVVLSMIGAIAGSSLGIVVGLPIPLLGPAVAAILGGAVGAYCGAYAGERWTGRTPQQQIEAARGAFSGRLWGTLGKIAVGAVMLVIITVDSLF